MRRLTIALTFVALALLVSLAANVALFRQAREYYEQANAARLDPLDLDAYPQGPPAQDPRQPGQRLAVFFGDSRAAQWPDPPGLAGLAFVNRGVGAQTSAQVRLRFDAHVRPLRPDIVIVQVGINDLKTIPLFPENRAGIVANCEEQLRQIVAASRDAGATVVLTTIFPSSEVPLERRLFWSSDVDAAVREVNAFISSLAAPDVLAFDAYALLAPGDAVEQRYYENQLHLNEAGYARLNEGLPEALRQTLP